MDQSIFLDFALPNAVTWFYFSLILAIALFFQFARPVCLRNLDLLTLFLLAPGFLILQEAHRHIAAGQGERGRRELLLGYGLLLVASAYWATRRSVFFSPPPPIMIGTLGRDSDCGELSRCLAWNSLPLNSPSLPRSPCHI